MNLYVEYSMEELLPILAELTSRYTGIDSTSVTYEKTEMLMGAILYCLNEAKSISGNEYQPVMYGEKIAVKDAYDRGLKMVKDKAVNCLVLYNQIMEKFDSYGNICLEDTMLKGMPEFFLRYDVNFAPQDEILTLDYPVKKHLEHLAGVDLIYEYLLCIKEEQDYLHKFSKEQVVKWLTNYHWNYMELIENLRELIDIEIKKEVIKN